MSLHHATYRQLRRIYSSFSVYTQCAVWKKVCYPTIFLNICKNPHLLKIHRKILVMSSLAMQNLSNLDFVAFTVTLLYFIQWSTLLISFWNSSLLASGFFTIAVSSAKSVDEELKTACGRSLIYIKNSSVPKTEPWGTPYLTWRFVLTVLLICIHWYLSDK